MSNRLTLVGTLIVALSAACPSVATAQNHSTNPWRADPQASGQYYTPQPVAPLVQKPLSAPKYAPLDGNVNAEDRANSGYPAMGLMNAYPGLGYRPYGLGYGRNYGPNYSMSRGYGASPYLGGLGYPSSGGGGFGPFNDWGSPYGGSGLMPGLGLGNGLGGPMSWMPFW